MLHFYSAQNDYRCLQTKGRREITVYDYRHPCVFLCDIVLLRIRLRCVDMSIGLRID
jgi:hypothetical protein